MNTNSMGFIFGVSAVLTIGVIFVPMTTSLGQNITEANVTGWQGEYETDTHEFKLRMETTNPQTTVVVNMDAIPLSDFSEHRGLNWYTPLDTAAPMQAAARQDPHLLDQSMGTRNNVFTPFTPFPGNPVSFSVSMLNTMARNHVNLDEFGGPDIPPGSVPVSHLPGGMLQIDTRANANTFKQLTPGKMPLELSYLINKYH